MSAYMSAIGVNADVICRWRAPPNGLARDQSMNYTGGDPLETGHGAPGRGHNQIPPGAYPLSAGEGSRCTINGQDGRLVRKGSWLVCEPVRRDAMPVEDARAEAYRRYDEEMANAWKNPR